MAQTYTYPDLRLLTIAQLRRIARELPHEREV
jgi:hypothetical protein